MFTLAILACQKNFGRGAIASPCLNYRGLNASCSLLNHTKHT